MTTPELPHLYQGKQAIINSDRILFNAKTDSVLLYSSQHISLSCNGEIHLDTSDGESKVVINSPEIYLGLDDGNLAKEAAVLGEQNEVWLNELCDLVEELLFILGEGGTYQLMTTTPGTPTAPNPSNVGILKPIVTKIGNMRKNIELIKSKRVKIV